MITASAVKDLRDKTGAGMMDCKKALVETQGNLEAAVDWLRKKGLSNAAKKADRAAAEGLTAAIVADQAGVVIEINSETDFVARNEKFQELVTTIVREALKFKDLESLRAAKLSNGKTIDEEIVENVAVIGENLILRRMDRIEVNNGIVCRYVHNSVASGLGKIAVIVGIESTADKEKLSSLGSQLAMHIAAAKPQSLDISGLDPAIIRQEREIFAEQSRNSGKPAEIVEKMTEGRIRKFYEEVVLLEQIFIIDGKTKISEVISNFEKELGTKIKINKFVRFELGEGIIVEEKSFADEVASIIKQ